MRDGLTLLSGLLVVVLTTALLGPMCVDWRTQRGAIERFLSAEIGVPIRTAGYVDLALLPTPRLDLEALEIGTPGPAQPRLTAARARVELSLPKLLHGEWHLSDVVLEEPDLRLTLGADGSLADPGTPSTSGPSGAPNRIPFEHLAIKSGHIRLEDPVRERAIDLKGLDLDMSGDSLLGPFKGTGALQLPNGTAATLRLTTGAVADSQMPLKLHLETAQGLRADLDGLAGFASAGADGALVPRLSYLGHLGLADLRQAGDLPLAWQASGTLDVDSAGADLSDLVVRLGDEGRAVEAHGGADLAFTAVPQAHVTLSAKQVDLDRLLTAGKPDATLLAKRLTGLLAPFLSPARDLRRAQDAPPQRSISVDLTTPALLMVGQVRTDVALHLAQTQGSPTSVSATVGGPEGGSLALSGTLDMAVAPHFVGHVDMARVDTESWLTLTTPFFPEVGARLQILPAHLDKLAGDVDLSDQDQAITNLALTTPHSHVTGEVHYAAKREDARAHWQAALASASLDSDDVRALASLPSADTDGALELDLTAAGDAHLKLSGKLEPGTTTWSGHLAARDLSPLARLLARLELGQPALTQALAKRAASLSPAALDLTFAGPRGTASTQVPALHVTGTLAGTSVLGDVHPDPANPSEVMGHLTLDTADTPALLRQGGGPSLPLQGLGPSHVALALQGQSARGFDVHGGVNLAGVTAEIDGRLSGASPSLAGTVRLESPNGLPLLQALGVVLPDGTNTQLPLALSAQLQVGANQVQASHLAGRIADRALVGDLAVSLTPGQRAKLTGGLRIDHLSWGDLTQLVLGPTPSTRAPQIWADAPFGVGLADPPDVAITLATRRFQTLPDGPALPGDMRLEITPNRLHLQDLALGLPGGLVRGEITWQRAGTTAQVSSKLQLENVTMATPALTGRLSGQVEATSSGDTWQSLVGHLAGAGHVDIAVLQLPNTDPAALPQVVAQTGDATNGDEAALGARLTQGLAKGPLDLGTRAYDVGLAGGVMRMAPVEAAVPVASVLVRTGASIDLNLFTLDAEVRLSLATAPPDWGDSTLPQVRLTWQGPWQTLGSTMQRGLDVRSLNIGLMTRALAQQATPQTSKSPAPWSAQVAVPPAADKVQLQPQSSPLPSPKPKPKAKPKPKPAAATPPVTSPQAPNRGLFSVFGGP